MQKFRTALIALAAASTAIIAAPAAAETAKLKWKDLDLSTEAGRTELDRRIGVAADQLCRLDSVTGSILPRPATPECLAEARDQIQTKLASRMPSSPPLAATARGNPEAR